jgi:tetratricopeptide (TPR) repeat protein
MGRPRDQAVTGNVALELCRREGAVVLLAGSITRLGSHYVFGLEGLNCASGESIGREVVEVESKDEVLAAVGSAARRMRSTLGESRASLRRSEVPIVEATTPSLEALEALSLGDRARDQERLADALMYYRRATDVDPNFAVAWARRGAAAQNMGRAVGDDRSVESEETKICFQRAFELGDRVSEVERLYIRGHYYRFVAGDTDRAIETYRTWIRTYPGSLVPTTNLASTYINSLGRYQEALLDAREAVRLAPSSSITNSALVASYLGSNRLEDAKQALREAVRKGVNDLSIHRLAFEVAFATGDEAGMLEQVRWAAADPAAAMVMSELQALAAASKGRLQEARRHWADATASAAKAGTVGVRAGCLLRQAEAEALVGDLQRARAAADQALAIDGQPTTRLAAAAVFALTGNPPRAGRLLNDVSRGEALTGSSKAVWQPVARALAMSVSGQPDKALELLQPTIRFERGRFFGLVPLGVRGSVERSAGRPRQAAATFGELLNLRHVVPMSPWVTYARLGLARALLEAGDLAGSRSAYDELLEGMKQADADSPVVIAARRERAAIAEGR